MADENPQFSFGRYLYLNSWGLFVVTMAVIVALVPGYKYSYWLVALQFIVVIILAKIGIGILRSWPAKKRKYVILMERNRDDFRPDTFREYMTAPCGILLAKVVLKDLGQEKRYGELKRYRGSLLTQIKQIHKGCQRQKTVIRYRPENNITIKTDNYE